MFRNLAKRVIYRIMRQLGTIREYARYFILYPIALALYKDKEIYLVSERGKDARDNGYHMFSFIRKNHPEKKCYYVIDKNSSDFKKVSNLGEIIQYRSLQHYLLFIGAKYKISTHVMGCSPDAERYISLHKKHRIPGFHVFLQHGITKDNIEGLYKENIGVDLFICGAQPEYEFVSKFFHYDKEVKYTGLARYDSLMKPEVKNYILFMPTWRVYLRNADDKTFINSSYYKCWYSLLNNQNLLESINQMNMKIVFYPHYEMQRFLHLFESHSDNVVIADFDHFDVQNLLKEAKILITDYSSVFFDFAYMNKPCVYYQFDEEEFFSKHYHHGYFDYRDTGFGEVLTDEDQIAAVIIEYLNSNCALKDRYSQRIHFFFPLHDDKNCERIFDAIETLQ